MMIIEKVIEELAEARSRFPDFRSYHEGFAVLKEEVDGLWDAIKDNDFDDERLEKEAIQVAAMALRFLYDCCSYVEGRDDRETAEAA